MQQHYADGPEKRLRKPEQRKWPTVKNEYRSHELCVCVCLYAALTTMENRQATEGEMELRCPREV